MKTLKLVIAVICFVLAVNPGNAQNNKYRSLFQKATTEKSNADLRFYGGLAHQHQDYFNQAFSLQGVEAGLILKDHLFLGIFGSAFVSNMKVEIENNPMYILMYQVGFSGGYLRKSSNLFHAGVVLNAGYFSLAGDDAAMPLFRIADHEISISGLVVSPQVFGEVNVTYWMKFRTGLAYNFYSFGNNLQVSESDIGNISINFGFLFGKFN
jgi:hypothetical protein